MLIISTLVISEYLILFAEVKKSVTVAIIKPNVVEEGKVDEVIEQVRNIIDPALQISVLYALYALELCCIICEIFYHS